MRKIAKVDSNQSEIVKELRAVGAKVQHLHQVGSGCPDILCGFRGDLYLMELKDAGGKLTPDERDFHREWADFYVGVIRTAEDALRFIGATA